MKAPKSSFLPWRRLDKLSSLSTGIWLLTALVRLNAASAYWGYGSNSDNEDADLSLYGQALERDWLYDSTSVSLKLEGCMWVSTGNSNGNNGCMENNSGDGTTYWYKMANCRRAQAVFSIYASSGSSTSCSSKYFKESFYTKNGLSEFVYYMQAYDANNPFGDYYGADDDSYDDDGNSGNNNANSDYKNLPSCEKTNNGYIGIGCNSDSTFALVYFSDQYCLQPTGVVYNKLRQLNRQLKAYRSCHGIYYYGSQNNLAQILAYNSESCSSIESSLCTDSNSMSTRRAHSSGKYSHSSNASSSSKTSALLAQTWVTKLKYAAGCILLLASFVMFTGILFTNRRRRRALMQRKFRQGKNAEGTPERGHRSKRAKSKTRESSSSRRSKSKSRKSDGVFT